MARPDGCVFFTRISRANRETTLRRLLNCIGVAGGVVDRRQRLCEDDHWIGQVTGSRWSRAGRKDVGATQPAVADYRWSEARWRACCSRRSATVRVRPGLTDIMKAKRRTGVTHPITAFSRRFRSAQNEMAYEHNAGQIWISVGCNGILTARAGRDQRRKTPQSMPY